MKEQTMKYASAHVDEHWAPSMQLRNLIREGKSNDEWIIVETVLQQLFTSNLGNSQWKDVPVETEN